MLRFLIVFYIFFISTGLPFAQVIHFEDGNTTGLTPEQLAIETLQNLDFQVLSVEFSGGNSSIASFNTEDDSPIGIEHGVVLSTGRVISIGSVVGLDGVGNQFASSGGGGVINEVDLSQLIGGTVTSESQSLIIEFIPFTDSLVIDFVFGSEEYPEYSCSVFNDVFGVFLSGPGINGPFSNNAENIALIPGTNTYASINNLHPEFNQNCPAVFEEFYIDNTESTNQPVLDGFTTVFPIRYPVIPLQTYQMKLAVADVGDNVFDTGVFMQFSDPYEGLLSDFFDPDQLIIPETQETVNFYLDLTEYAEATLPLEISIGGDAVNGVDYEQLPESFLLTVDNPILDFDLKVINDTETEPMESFNLVLSQPQIGHLRTIEYFITEPFQSDIEIEEMSDCSAEVSIALTLPPVSLYEYEYTESVPITEPDIMVEIPLEVTGVPYDVLFKTELLESVCINVEHDWIGDIDVWLIAPSGESLILTKDNGANGDNYTNTCFSPTATQHIYSADASPPFTGDWLPEGEWEKLRQAEVNGIWKLRVKDDYAAFTGNVTNWSITFNDQIFSEDEISWSTGDVGLETSFTADYPASVNYTIQNSLTTNENTIWVGGSPFLINEESCDEDFYMEVNGTVYDISNPTGTEILPGAAANGCDSLINIQINFIDTPENIYLTENFEDGNSIEIAGTTISEPGHYEFQNSTPSGCIFYTYLSFLPAVTTPSFGYPDMVQEVIPCDPEGTEICLNYINYFDEDFIIHIDAGAYGYLSDLPICSEIMIQECSIEEVVFQGNNQWRISEIEGLDIPDDFGFFNTQEEFIMHLSYSLPDDFVIYEFNDKIRVYSSSNDIEAVIIEDSAENEIFTLEFGDVILPAGFSFVFTGEEEEIKFIADNFTEAVFPLDLSIDLQPTPIELEALHLFGADWNSSTVTFDEPVFDELCGGLVSLENVCAENSTESLTVTFEEGTLNTMIGIVMSPEEAQSGNTYSVCLVGCDEFGVCQEVNITNVTAFVDSTDDIIDSSEILLSPNPTNGEVLIESLNESLIEAVKVYTTTGQLIEVSKVAALNTKLKIEGAAGVYYLEIITDEGRAFKKVVKY